MATGQTLLDTMEVLNQELQLQPGEADVTRGLTALNRAQDYFESMAALRKILGGQTGTVVTASSTERTAFPTSVLRIDRLQLLDSTTSRPKYDLKSIRRVGGHAATSYWPLNLTTYGSSGDPAAYWTDGSYIYWSPLPSGISTVRWYGFQRASDITASGTFAYDDGVILPLASFAAQLLKIGLDDSGQELSGLATVTFQSILDTLEHFNRDGAVPLQYTQRHDS